VFTGWGGEAGQDLEGGCFWGAISFFLHISFIQPIILLMWWMVDFKRKSDCGRMLRAVSFTFFRPRTPIVRKYQEIPFFASTSIKANRQALKSPAFHKGICLAILDNIGQ